MHCGPMNPDATTSRTPMKCASATQARLSVGALE
jgi:hypothetical protein